MTNKLPIISADERLRTKKGITIAVFGETGIGKTSLLKTLKVPTLCLDLEAGLLAVPDWKGDSLKIDTWDMARDIACLIGGVNKASKDGNVYSQSHFNQARARWGDASQFNKYACLFVDSITVATRLCLQWCRTQSSNSDPRAAFGLMASEMMLFLNQCQNFEDKDTIFVGILEKRTNEFNQVSWALQIEGTKLGLELPGIVDEVLILTTKGPISSPDKEPPRIFICKPTNNKGYPAKDRSGKLKVEEPADLDHILTKIKRAKPDPSSPLLFLPAPILPPESSSQTDETNAEESSPFTQECIAVTTEEELAPSTQATGKDDVQSSASPESIDARAKEALSESAQVMDTADDQPASPPEIMDNAATTALPASPLNPQ